MRSISRSKTFDQLSLTFRNQPQRQAQSLSASSRHHSKRSSSGTYVSLTALPATRPSSDRGKTSQPLHPCKLTDTEPPWLRLCRLLAARVPVKFITIRLSILLRGYDEGSVCPPVLVHDRCSELLQSGVSTYSMRRSSGPCCSDAGLVRVLSQCQNSAVRAAVESQTDQLSDFKTADSSVRHRISLRRRANEPPPVS